jgi:hypothetical protein
MKHLPHLLLTGTGVFLALISCTDINRTNPTDTGFSGTTGSLSGKILLQGEADNSGIEVYVISYGRSDIYTTTDAAGNFTLNEIPVVGTSPVTIGAWYPADSVNFNTVKFDVTIEGNTTKEMDSTGTRTLTRVWADYGYTPVAFDGLTGTLEGWVRLEGQASYESTMVQLVVPEDHMNRRLRALFHALHPHRTHRALCR